MVVEGSGFYAY